MFIFKKQVLTATRTSEPKKKKRNVEKTLKTTIKGHVLLIEILFGISSQSVMRKCEFFGEI